LKIPELDLARKLDLVDRVDGDLSPGEGVRNDEKPRG
jgi:hypothetical protein